MRIILLGTGPFVVPTLRALNTSDHELLLVVSRPPRGRRAPPAPVCVAANALGVEVWTPVTVNSDDARARLAALEADLLVVCDYGEILKGATLDVTRLGGINLHGSLLPKYRGAAPVQWAVLNGDAETGNTVIQMTSGLDAGPALGIDRVTIGTEETAGELEARLAELGAHLVLQVVDQLARDSACPVVQDSSQATRAPRLTKADGLIDWSCPSGHIHNRVRAMQPWPRAYTHWLRDQGEPLRLIVHRVANVNEEAGVGDFEPGTVLQADSRLLVATGDGPLEVLELQPAGKKSLLAGPFLRGYPVRNGDRLGNSSLHQN
ncbi:MAG: methionyl-tRNA formyltransferase [Pirellulales bacterium]